MADNSKLARIKRKIEQAEGADDTEALREALSELAPFLLNDGNVAGALVEFTRVKTLPGA